MQSSMDGENAVNASGEGKAPFAFRGFVSFLHSRTLSQHCHSVAHSLPLHPSQLKAINIVKQLRTSQCYMQSCFLTIFLISFAGTCC